MRDVVELEGRIEHETTKAYLVDFVAGGKPEWLPKSVVVDIGDVDGHLSYFVVPCWWARKTGLSD